MACSKAVEAAKSMSLSLLVLFTSPHGSKVVRSIGVVVTQPKEVELLLKEQRKCEKAMSRWLLGNQSNGNIHERLK